MIRLNPERGKEILDKLQMKCAHTLLEAEQFQFSPEDSEYLQKLFRENAAIDGPQVIEWVNSRVPDIFIDPGIRVGSIFQEALVAAIAMSPEKATITLITISNMASALRESLSFALRRQILKAAKMLKPEEIIAEVMETLKDKFADAGIEIRTTTHPTNIIGGGGLIMPEEGDDYN